MGPANVNVSTMQANSWRLHSAVVVLAAIYIIIIVVR